MYLEKEKFDQELLDNTFDSLLGGFQLTLFDERSNSLELNNFQPMLVKALIMQS